jgi:glycosyltransferase involved in cell wall biosynthesis
LRQALADKQWGTAPLRPNRMSSTIRPLLIAEACNPTWVSIPLEGWSHSRAIMEIAGGHLVTQVRNREAILAAGLIEGRDFTAIDSERVAKPVYRLAGLLRGGAGKGWTTSTALSSLVYPYFEKLIWKQFARRLHEGEFNLVHRLTPLSPTTPSPLATLCRRMGIPFLLGPLNGGVPWPKGFDAARRREKEWLSYVRDAYRLVPGYLSTRRDAAAILIGSRDTWRQMPRVFHDKCFYVPENAIDPARFQEMRTRKAQKPIRAVFVGRLVPYKGADMLLEAAGPLVKRGELTVRIIGDGPQMPLLKEMVRRDGIESGVELLGWVKHEELQKRLAESDVFAFPSVREFGGAVVLEAMAVGVTPIVVAYGGPAELVTEKTGFLLPIGSREEIVMAMRKTLSDICERPDMIEARSAAAMARAREYFTWNAKAKSVVEIYKWMLDPSQPRPEFAMPIPD